MFKFLGGIVAVGSAASIGSLLFIPFMIFAAVGTAWEGLTSYWPWLVAGIGYGIIIWIATMLTPTFSLKAVTGTVLSLLPPIVIVVLNGLNWTSFVVAALSTSVFFGVAAQGAARYSIVYPRAISAQFSRQTRMSIRDFGSAGAISAAQATWLAPTAVMFLTFPSVFPIFASLAGAIMTFFVVEELDPSILNGVSQYESN